MGSMQNTRSETHMMPYNPLSGVARLRPDLLGFVFHLSWLYLLMYSGAVVASRTGSLVSFTDSRYVCSLLALGVTVAVGIWRTKAFMRVCESRAGVVAAPALMVAGTVLYCADSFVPAAAFVVAGGLLTGVGSAAMAARWASVFGGTSSRSVVENLPTLLAVIVVICASVNYIPREVCMALVVVLPLLSAAALQYARRYQRGLAEQACGAGTGGVGALRDTAAVGCDALAWGSEGGGLAGAGAAAAGEGGAAGAVACGDAALAAGEGAAVLRGGKRAVTAEVGFVGLMGFTIAVMPSIAAVGFDYSAVFYGLSGLFVLLFAGAYIARFERRNLLVLFAVPVLVLLMALLPLVRFGAQGFGSALEPAGNCAFELVLLFGCVLLARLTDASPARMFLIGRLSLAVFDWLGSAAGSLLKASVDSVMLAQVAGVLLFASCELLLLGLVVAFLSTSRKTAAAAAGGDGVAPASQATVSAQQQAASEASRGQAHASASPDVAQPAESLQTHLAAVADRFGLSERERDVFALLAEGRTSARIQEELCIAAGTVNYHTRNIYSKLGVHSRQELIDLVRGE